MLMELTPSYDFFLTIILKLFFAFLDEPSFGHTSLYCLMHFAAGQIPSLHDDSRHAFYLRHGRCAQH